MSGPEMVGSKPAVVLLSGGLDSTTCVALAQQQGYRVYGISFRYGQRHSVELAAAERIARHYAIGQHIVLDIDLRQFGGSALTDQIEVPKHADADQLGGEIPVTYVPARNTVFLSLALAWAETLGAKDIFIGVNAMDYSGYPDCRPEFIAAFEQLANLATKVGVEGPGKITIHAPLIQLTKAQIIQLGLELEVDYGLTTSCYDPSPEGHPCGGCDACLLRRRGFTENGMPEPVFRALDESDGD